MSQYEAKLELTRRDLNTELSIGVDGGGGGVGNLETKEELRCGWGVMGFSQESRFTGVG